MKSLTVAEFKAHFSAMLSFVKEGESVQILYGKAKKILEDGKNEVFVSTLSFWEISMKTMARKFPFTGLDPAEIPVLASKMGYSHISLDSSEAASYHRLPFRGDHRDPFDRMLIWQAVSRRLVMVSKDKDFDLYAADGLRIVW